MMACIVHGWPRLLPYMVAILAYGGLVAADTVQLSVDEVELPWHTSTPMFSDIANWARASAFNPMSGSRQAAGTRRFQRLVLENRWYRVEVIPEAGGALGGAVFKPANAEVFYREGKAKDWKPYWESAVKASFPFREHGTPTVGAPASWRVIRHDDGSVTIAEWMEFSRNVEAYHLQQYGRHTTMTLGQMVTLHPDRAAITIRYRVTNPDAFKQGRQLWVDAYFPRFDSPRGCIQADAEPPMPGDGGFIYPVAWVCDHHGKDTRRATPDLLPFSAYTKPHTSVFALGCAYGFVGTYHPTADTNRLRLTDAASAPAAKLYLRNHGGWKADDADRHMYNYVEIWGGTDDVFEIVEQWLEPGCSFELEYDFVYARAIGETVYADRTLAIGYRDGALRILTWHEEADLRASIGDRSVQDACGPDRPLVLPSPLQGRLRIQSGDRILAEVDLPLRIPDDPAIAARVPEVVKDPVIHERYGDAQVHGKNVASAYGDARKQDPGSTRTGRLAYRLGRIQEAEQHLRRAIEDGADDGETWHLLGVDLLEQKRFDEARSALETAISHRQPYPAAGYYMAILDIRDGDRASAQARLAVVQVLVPFHRQAQVLSAALGLLSGDPGSVSDLRTVAADDPSDPIAAWLVAQIPGATKTERDDSQALLREPGARRRLHEFTRALAGEYLPALRIGDKVVKTETGQIKVE